MTFFSLEHLRVHWRVVNWPDFNISVSQGIGKHEERERNGEQLVSGAVRKCIYRLSSLSYVGRVCGVPKQLQS